MATHPIVFYIERPDLKMDDDRGKILAPIAQLAPASQLYLNSPVIQATFAALSKSYGLIKPASDLVAADEKKLRLDMATLVGNRGSFDGEVEAFFTLLEKDAK